jgi:RHS repeat-associated protein
VRQEWDKYSTGAAVLDQIKYGHDPASNDTWRQDALAEASSAGWSQFYTLDGLQRLKSAAAGILTGSPFSGVSGMAYSQTWTLDQLGNWSHFTATNDVSTTLDQSRGHNDPNELTSINSSTTLVGEDAAGNMTKAPVPQNTILNSGNWSSYDTLKYDAWNRLVEVKNSSGTTLETNRYDGLYERIQKIAGSDTYDDYYNQRWQVIEVRKNGNTNPLEQFVWHPYYIDALAVRYYDAAMDRSNIAIQYSLQDAHYNITALLDSTGAVIERYSYSPYGEVTMLNNDFSIKAPQLSQYDNSILFTCRERDSETGLQLNRFRFYHAQLGRWLTRDPIGYFGGINLYGYVDGLVVKFLDPWGLGWLLPPGFGSGPSNDTNWPQDITIPGSSSGGSGDIGGIIGGIGSGDIGNGDISGVHIPFPGPGTGPPIPIGINYPIPVPAGPFNPPGSITFGGGIDTGDGGIKGGKIQCYFHY